MSEAITLAHKKKKPFLPYVAPHFSHISPIILVFCDHLGPLLREWDRERSDAAAGVAKRRALLGAAIRLDPSENLVDRLRVAGADVQLDRVHLVAFRRGEMRLGSGLGLAWDPTGLAWDPTTGKRNPQSGILRRLVTAWLFEAARSLL